MKNVNTVEYEPLPDEMIEAARRRRQQDRFTNDGPRKGKIDFDQIELPDNHPFAVKKKMTEEEEQLQQARLEIRRGLPLQDLSGKRGFADS